jgi:hypothetical protein
LKRLPAISADSTGEIRADDILEEVDVRAAEASTSTNPPSSTRRSAPQTPTSIRPVAIEVPLPAYRAEPPSIDVTWDADATAPARARMASMTVRRGALVPVASHGTRLRTGVLVAGLSFGIALVGAALVQRGVTADAASPPIVVAAAPRSGRTLREVQPPPEAPETTPVTAPIPAPPPVVPASAAASAVVPAPAAASVIVPAPAAASAVVPASAAASAVVPAPAAARGAGRGDVPVVDVTSLPRPTTGKVIGAPSHRLFVDGHVEAASTALVPCGAHVVKVGSAGKPHSLDVPCGGEVIAPH